MLQLKPLDELIELILRSAHLFLDQDSSPDNRGHYLTFVTEHLVNWAICCYLLDTAGH
jgi:hypothetical protein